MSITQRRLKSGLRWQTDKPPRPRLAIVILDTAIIIAGISIVVAIYAFAGMVDARAEAEDQKRVVMHVTGHLATCMNGGGVIDRARNVAHMCGRAIEMPLPGGVREPAQEDS